jgi:hypothetical protein
MARRITPEQLLAYYQNHIFRMRPIARAIKRIYG